MAELTINTSDITASLQRNLADFHPEVELRQIGRVLEVGDGIARVSGLPDVGVNELLEFEGGVTLHDVLTVLQRSELVTRMAVEIERYIVELGAEGRLIEMQLEETMVGVAADKTALVRDYSVEDSEENLQSVLSTLAHLPHQDVLDFGRLAEMLGYDRKMNTLDFPVAPRGYRVLGRIPRLPRLVAQKIIQEFGGLEEVLAASNAELEAVDGVGETRAKDIREGIRRLQEVDLVDRYLQS
jgi:diadenylate cyclase